MNLYQAEKDRRERRNERLAAVGAVALGAFVLGFLIHPALIILFAALGFVIWFAVFMAVQK